MYGRIFTFESSRIGSLALGTTIRKRCSDLRTSVRLPREHVMQTEGFIDRLAEIHADDIE